MIELINNKKLECISIPNAEKIGEKDPTTYFIQVDYVGGDGYTIERRYIDFELLNLKLKDEFPLVAHPKISNYGNFYPKQKTEYLYRKRVQLEEYLIRVLAHQKLNKSPSFNYFLDKNIKSPIWKDSYNNKIGGFEFKIFNRIKYNSLRDSISPFFTLSTRTPDQITMEEQRLRNLHLSLKETISCMKKKTIKENNALNNLNQIFKTLNKMENLDDVIDKNLKFQKLINDALSIMKINISDEEKIAYLRFKAYTDQIDSLYNLETYCEEKIHQISSASSGKSVISLIPSIKKKSSSEIDIKELEDIISFEGTYSSSINTAMITPTLKLLINTIKVGKTQEEKAWKACLNNCINRLNLSKS